MKLEQQAPSIKMVRHKNKLLQQGSLIVFSSLYKLWKMLSKSVAMLSGCDTKPPILEWGQNSRFWKSDKTADFEVGQNHRFVTCNNTDC